QSNSGPSMWLSFAWGPMQRNCSQPIVSRSETPKPQNSSEMLQDFTGYGSHQPNRPLQADGTKSLFVKSSLRRSANTLASRRVTHRDRPWDSTGRGLGTRSSKPFLISKMLLPSGGGRRLSSKRPELSTLLAEHISRSEISNKP